MGQQMYTIAHISLLPEERLCRKTGSVNSLLIGMPKERGEFEKRLPLTPEAVSLLTNEGHHIVIESGAGESIHYPDVAYSDAGAQITDDVTEVWRCDIVLKVAPPTLQEVMLMKPKSTLISMMQLSFFPDDSLAMMLERRITGIAYELISDKTGQHPLINSISEIEGRTSIVIAAELLTNMNGGKGILLGGCAGISPTEVVIIGAGRAGKEAARTADALGAMVKLFDNDVDKLRMAQSMLGPSTFTSTLHPNVLANSLRSADVIVGTLRFENGERRYVVSEDLVAQMKKGALIIDLSVDQGGCFETSRCPKYSSEAVYEKFGITHYCVPNISSRVARTASISLSNYFIPILLNVGECGTINDYIRKQANFRSGVYIYNGKVVNKVVGEYFGCQWSDIMLFLTAFQ